MNTENQFINALKNPETQDLAFRKLVSDYKERLYWQIRKIVINHDDADDVLQNTFVKVFKNIKKFKGNSSMYTWMYRIATNESLNFINKKSKQMGISGEKFILDKINLLEADPYFEGDIIEIKLHKAIANLPQKQRIIFNMRYFDKMKYEKISEILGTSVGGLKASYHHAKNKIKTILNE